MDVVVAPRWGTDRDVRKRPQRCEPTDKEMTMKIQMMSLALAGVAGLVVGCEEKKDVPVTPTPPAQTTLDKAVEGANDAAKAVGDKAAEVTEAAKDAGAKAADKVSEAGAAAKDSVGGLMDKAKDAGASALEGLGNPEELIAKAKQLIAENKLADAKSILEKLKAVQDKLPEPVRAQLTDLLKQVGL
jgi:hypothetical protein